MEIAGENHSSVCLLVIPLSKSVISYQGVCEICMFMFVQLSVAFTFAFDLQCCHLSAKNSPELYRVSIFFHVSFVKAAERMWCVQF